MNLRRIFQRHRSTAPAVVTIISAVIVIDASVIMTTTIIVPASIGHVSRAMRPTATHPDAIMADHVPVSGYPCIVRSRASRCSHHHLRCTICRSNDHRRGGGNSHHRQRRQWQAERKAEMHPGLGRRHGRESGRTDKRGREKQFSFHKFLFYLLSGLIAVQVIRRREIFDVTPIG